MDLRNGNGGCYQEKRRNSTHKGIKILRIENLTTKIIRLLKEDEPMRRIRQIQCVVKYNVYSAYHVLFFLKLI